MSEPSPKPSWRRQLLLLGASLCVSLLLGELFVRVFTKVDPRFYNDMGTLWVIGDENDDPKSNPFHLPHGFKTARIGIEAMHIGHLSRFNSHGMRDPKEYTFEKPKGTRRVVLLGDSVVFGHTEESLRLPPQLRQALEAKLPGVAVETPAFSCPGWDFGSYLVVMKQAVSQFETDDVVIGFVLNDLMGSWVPMTKDGDIDVVSPTGDPEAAVLDWPWIRVVVRNSALLTAVIWVGKGFYAKSRPIAPDVAKLAEGPHAFDAAVEGLEPGFAWLARTCKERKLRCTVMVFPYGPQVEEGLARTVIESWYGKAFDPAVVNDGPQQAIRRACQRHNLPFVDLLPAFRAESDPGGLFFDTPEGRIDYVHLSPRGNAVVARALADVLAQPPVVSADPATPTTAPVAVGPAQGAP